MSALLGGPTCIAGALVVSAELPSAKDLECWVSGDAILATEVSVGGAVHFGKGDRWVGLGKRRSCLLVLRSKALTVATPVRQGVTCTWATDIKHLAR